MELFPKHSLELFNLFWFPMIYGILIIIVMLNVKKESKNRILTYPKNDNKIIQFFSLGFMIVFGKLIILYSIFVPIIAFTVYFYIGVIIYMVSISCSVYAMYYFSKADTSRPVTSSIYKYSRHPMQVMFYLSWIGLGLISGTWIIIIYTIIFSVLIIPSLVSQEKDCVEQYGDEYVEYLKRTPRFIFFKWKNWYKDRQIEHYYI